MVSKKLNILANLFRYLSLLLEFELLREIVLPKTTPAPGGSIFYKVTLQNFGDLSGLVKNIIIHCNGVENLTKDPDFTIVGKDTSSSQFKDTSQDAILGTVIDNIISFVIPYYHGEKYEFIYRAIINPDTPIGSEINTIAPWSINNISYPIDTHVFTLDAPIYNGEISLYGPTYSLPNEYVCYEFTIENTGNQILESTRFIEELPQEINYYEFRTGTFHYGEIDQEIVSNYTIDYTTINGDTGILGSFLTNINSMIDLSTIINMDNNLRSLTWSIPSIGVGVTNAKSSQLNGIIKNDILIGSSILNHFNLIGLKITCNQVLFQIILLSLEICAS